MTHRDDVEDVPVEKHRARVRGVEPLVQGAAQVLRRRETPAEKVLWQALRGRKTAGLKFRRQHAVGPFILDFYCPDHKLVIEIDGQTHDDPDAREHDTLRTAHLNRYGYHVLRFRNEQVLTDLPSVLATIAATPATLPPQTPLSQNWERGRG